MIEAGRSISARKAHSCVRQRVFEIKPILRKSVDVRSEETARSSYERCCRALCLPVEVSTANRSLQDVPYVQSVLLLLQNSALEEKWLVVVDNADDLSCNVSALVPKGKAGTVIVTSQDAQASRLLGGRTE